MTLLVTLSDISAAGIGAAFWGVVAGSVTLAVQNLAPPRSVFGAPQVEPPAARQSRFCGCNLDWAARARGDHEGSPKE